MCALTKEEVIAQLQKEVRILLHLASKIDRSSLDYRPTPKQRSTIELDDLSSEIRVHDPVALRPKRERRRTVADDLYQRLVEQRESFWTVVYPLYMQREITRSNVRDLVRKGLQEARGNYKIVARIFNMEQREYKRFLNFLRKHDCQVPFKEYR